MTQIQHPDLSQLPAEMLNNSMKTDQPLETVRLPFGIVLNQKNQCGLFISEKQAAAANIYYEPEYLISIPEFEEDNTGILLTEIQATILARTPSYLRYKHDEALGELSGTIVGPYNYDTHQKNKQQIDACVDVAFMFYNTDLQPLNNVPISVRFKNVSRWKFESALDSYYRAVEIAFYNAKSITKNRTQHDQRWRSNILLNLQCTEEIYGPEKGKKSSIAIWTIENEHPTKDNVVRALEIALYPELYQQQLELHDRYLIDYELILEKRKAIARLQAEEEDEETVAQDIQPSDFEIEDYDIETDYSEEDFDYGELNEEVLLNTF